MSGSKSVNNLSRSQDPHAVEKVYTCIVLARDRGVGWVVGLGRDGARD